MSIDLLQQAVDAAQMGNRAEAIKLTKDYIRQTPKDARGWWALTKFTDDPEVQRECLKRVLKLKPDHAQAQQMLDELECYIGFLRIFIRYVLQAPPTTFRITILDGR